MIPTANCPGWLSVGSKLGIGIPRYAYSRRHHQVQMRIRRVVSHALKTRKVARERGQGAKQGFFFYITCKPFASLLFPACN
jgi:hypothetical protein